MKGQSNIIQHIITVLLGTIIMISLIALAYSYYGISLRNQITEQLNQIAIQIKDNIVKLNDLGKNSRNSPQNSSIILIGEVEQNLPSRISGKNYRILVVSANPGFSTITGFTVENATVNPVVKTSGAKIIAQTLEDPKITIEQEIPNIDAGVQGKSDNGVESKLSYFRYNSNGTVYNKIVLGDSGVLVEISSIS